MNIPGYMLVLTGTPKLFPLMDDVFSPIVRQFKKFCIGPFLKETETKSCIEKPLEKLGIKHPSEIFSLETFSDVKEIHELSGGKPYEIQLICHFLFRKIQQGKAQRMELTLDDLDEVIQELETSQDLYSRPIIRRIRELEKNKLASLNLLCMGNGQLSFEQVWFFEYLRTGGRRFLKIS